MEDRSVKSNEFRYFSEFLNAEPLEADILAELFKLSRYYKENMSVLIPVLKAIIDIHTSQTNGRVVIHLGKGTKGRYAYSVESRKIIDSKP